MNHSLPLPVFPRKSSSLVSPRNLTSPGIRVFELGTGLRLAIEEDTSVPLAAFIARVHAGSISESEHLGSGLSHLLEHAMFLGCRNIPQKDGFSHIIEQYGGIDLNAYTTYDHTAYFATVFAEKLHPALKALMDFLFHPLFPKKALMEEMGTIHSEMQMVADRPSWVFYHQIQEIMYAQTPYAAPIIGDRKMFDRLRLRDVRTYHRVQYHPKNIVLSLKGAISTEVTLDFLKKLLQTSIRELSEHPLNERSEPNHPHKEIDLLGQNVLPVSPSPQKVAGSAPLKKSTRLKSIPLAEVYTTNHPCAKHVKLALCWKGPTLGEQKDIPLSLLASLLTGGESTPLPQLLKHRLGLVHSISASTFSPPRYFADNHGTFTLTLSPRIKDLNKLEVEIREILKTIFDELRRMVLLNARGKIRHKKSLTAHTTHKHGQPLAAHDRPQEFSAAQNSRALQALRKIMTGIKNETQKELIDEREQFLEAASATAAAIQIARSTAYNHWYLKQVQEAELSDLLDALQSELLHQPARLFILTPEKVKLKKRLFNLPVHTVPSVMKPLATKSQAEQKKKPLRTALRTAITEQKFPAFPSLLVPTPPKDILGEKAKPNSNNRVKGETAEKIEPQSESLPNGSQIRQRRGSTQLQQPKTVYPPFKKKTLANGLVWMQTARASLPKITLAIRMRGGQAFEGEAVSLPADHPLAGIGKIPPGAFSLLSRMLLTSSQKFSKRRLHERLKTFAIDYSTSSGTNSYSLKLSYLKEHHPIVLDLLRSTLIDRSLSARDLKQERAELIFELKREGESLSRTAGRGFSRAFYAGTPYALPLKGNEESLMDCSHSLIEKLLQVSLTGENTVASLHGDFHPDEADALTGLLESLPTGLDSKSLTPFTYPTYKLSNLRRTAHAEKFLSREEAGAQETHLRIGFRGPSLRSRQTLALALIRSHLSGMGGPLFKLRSMDFVHNGKSLGGRAYALGCTSHTERDFSSLILYAALRKEARGEVGFMRDAFLAELQKLVRKPLRVKELQSAKDAFRSAEMMSSLSWIAQAASETLYETYGMHPHSERRRLATLQSLSAEEVRSAAARFLSKDAFLEYTLYGEG